MKFDDYLNIDALNASQLKAFAKSPAHWSLSLSKTWDTKAFALGALVHTLVLEPDLFDDLYLLSPKIDRRTKAGKDLYKEISSTDKTVITIEDYGVAEQMRHSVISHELTPNFLSDGDAEKTILFDIDGHPCKARLDFLGDDLTIWDLKTTKDAHPKRFKWDYLDLFYNVQLGFYLLAVSAEYGVPVDLLPAPKIVAVGKVEPYMASVYTVDDPVFQATRAKELARTLLQFKQNDETDDVSLSYNLTLDSERFFL